jgi:CRP-like cAMP-binding protein
VRRKGKKVKTLGPGSFVGEIALLSKIPRVATVTAITPTSVLVITDRAFMDLCEKSPSIAVKVARTLADRVGENELTDRARS